MKKIDWIKTGRFVLISAGIVIIIMAMISMIGSLLVTKELLSLEVVQQLQTVLMAIVVLIVCLISAQRAGHGKMIVSIITALVIIGCFMLAKLLFYPAERFNIGLNMVTFFLSAILAGIISGRKRSRR